MIAATLGLVPQQGIRMRVAVPEDIDGIWRLCISHFPEFRGFEFEAFKELCLRKWFYNPARTSNNVFGWILEGPAGEILGFIGQVPVRFKNW